MPIFGTDTAKYQPLGTYDPGAFEIINAQDPGVHSKIDRNKADGRPWGLYVWVYPGQSGASLTDVAASVIARAGTPPLGVWWDYEDPGVGEWQLQQAFAEADARGIKSGYYSNAHTANHGLFLDRPWWYAAYPGNNDGSFPGLGAMRNPRPVHIWQYSSGGGLDRNVIVDEGWYSDFTDTTGELFTVDQMGIIGQWLKDVEQRIEAKILGDVGQWLKDVEARVNAHTDEAIAQVPGGAGGGLSEEQTRAIVREELDRTRLGS